VRDSSVLILAWISILSEKHNGGLQLLFWLNVRSECNLIESKRWPEESSGEKEIVTEEIQGRKSTPTEHRRKNIENRTHHSDFSLKSLDSEENSARTKAKTASR
jgi:hypothetical protein